MFDWQHACRHNATCQEPELVPYDARDRVSLCADVHHIRHGHALLAGDHIYSASVEQYHRLLILRVLQRTESSTPLLPDRGGVIMVTGQESMAVACVVHVSTWLKPIPRVQRNEL